jgi:hypothetical protein
MQFKSCNMRKLRGQRLIGFTLLELLAVMMDIKGAVLDYAGADPSHNGSNVNTPAGMQPVVSGARRRLRAHRLQLAGG